MFDFSFVLPSTNDNLSVARGVLERTISGEGTIFVASLEGDVVLLKNIKTFEFMCVCPHSDIRQALMQNYIVTGILTSVDTSDVANYLTFIGKYMWEDDVKDASIAKQSGDGHIRNTNPDGEHNVFGIDFYAMPNIQCKFIGVEPELDALKSEQFEAYIPDGCNHFFSSCKIMVRDNLSTTFSFNDIPYKTSDCTDIIFVIKRDLFGEDYRYDTCMKEYLGEIVKENFYISLEKGPFRAILTRNTDNEVHLTVFSDIVYRERPDFNGSTKEDYKLPKSAYVEFAKKMLENTIVMNSVLNEIKIGTSETVKNSNYVICEVKEHEDINNKEKIARINTNHPVPVDVKIVVHNDKEVVRLFVSDSDTCIGEIPDFLFLIKTMIIMVRSNIISRAYVTEGGSNPLAVIYFD